MLFTSVFSSSNVVADQCWLTAVIYTKCSLRGKEMEANQAFMLVITLDSFLLHKSEKPSQFLSMTEINVCSFLFLHWSCHTDCVRLFHRCISHLGWKPQRASTHFRRISSSRVSHKGMRVEDICTLRLWSSPVFYPHFSMSHTVLSTVNSPFCLLLLLLTVQCITGQFLLPYYSNMQQAYPPEYHPLQSTWIESVCLTCVIAFAPSLVASDIKWCSIIQDNTNTDAASPSF